MAYKQYNSPFNRVTENDDPPGKRTISLNIKSATENIKSRIQEKHPNFYKTLNYRFAATGDKLKDIKFNIPISERKKKERLRLVSDDGSVKSTEKLATGMQTDIVEGKDKKFTKDRFQGIDEKILNTKFVREHHGVKTRLTNALKGTNFQVGNKRKDTSYQESTPWQRYRAYVKEAKEDIRSKPLFSADRRLARRDFRGKWGATIDKKTGRIVNTPRHSYKNRLQATTLSGRSRRNNAYYGTHNPHIPAVKEKSIQLANVSNKEIAEYMKRGATNYNFTTTQNSTNTARAQTFCGAAGKCNQVKTRK